MTQSGNENENEVTETSPNSISRRHFIAAGAVGIVASSSVGASAGQASILQADKGPWAQARKVIQSGDLGDVRHLQGGAHEFDGLLPVMCGFLYAIGPALPVSVMALGESRGDEGYLMTALYEKGHRIVLVCGDSYWKGGPQIVRGDTLSLEVHGDSVRFAENPNVGHGYPDDLNLWDGSADEFGDEIKQMATVALDMGLEAQRAGHTISFDEFRGGRSSA